MAEQFFGATNTLALAADRRPHDDRRPAGFLLHLLARLTLRRRVAVDDATSTPTP